MRYIKAVAFVSCLGATACGSEADLPRQVCQPQPPTGAWRNVETGDVLRFVGGHPTISHQEGGKTALSGQPYDGPLPVTCGWRPGPRHFESLQPVQDGFRLVLRADPGAQFAGTPTSVVAGAVPPDLGIVSGPQTPLASRVEISETGSTLTATVVLDRLTLGGPTANVSWSLRWQMRDTQGVLSDDGVELDARFACTSRCVLNLEWFTEECLEP